MTYGCGKSDSAILAGKPTNKAEQSAAESVERRVEAKGNTGQQSTYRAQDRESVSQALDRIRRVARHRKKEKFTALFHHITAQLLREAFFELKENAAPGVDGLRWGDYETDLERRLEDLHARLQRGAYRALPGRRGYIPKSDGQLRPLAVAALEDKIVQRATVAVLNAIYEEDFLGFSYGFRAGRGPHDALDALVVGISSTKVNWILDADIRSFLDPASYYPLVHEAHANSSPCRAITLMRSPFWRPRVTWTASSSPRLTRCNTVCRETPRARIASRIGRKPAAASALKRAFSSSVRRMRQGAPGVICSPAMKPSFSRRWIVDGATPSAKAARLMVTSSPSAASAFGTKHGIGRERDGLLVIGVIDPKASVLRLHVRNQLPQQLLVLAKDFCGAADRDRVSWCCHSQAARSSGMARRQFQGSSAAKSVIL
jgi:Reverse transcriptase (RNA-dependent DNA polymerase)